METSLVICYYFHLSFYIEDKFLRKLFFLQAGVVKTVKAALYSVFLAFRVIGELVSVFLEVVKAASAMG